MDLDGDGLLDLLISEDRAFRWYRSRGEEGFGPAESVPAAGDEERGPRLLFADGTQSIYLADMSGDGLADLVRVRNGEICYWPNLGYGRFGPKVTMDRAPRFDHPDQFSQRRVRLADVDGSGTSDIIYLGRDGVRLYFNQSGNGWSEPHRLSGFPLVDDLSQVMTADLLGNGTACLVWSSPLPDGTGRTLRYIDLMGGQKPHLLIRIVNNCGAETRIHYAPSTAFYLADKAAGRPWKTRLPFPLHVVERVESLDHVSRSRFVTRYVYHHGCFDGVEREFRGFGMVEQEDTEAYEDYVAGVVREGGDQERAPELFQPPVTTRTWFHTGAPVEGAMLADPWQDEYYQGARALPPPILPAGLDAGEWRESLRALKGLVLRQEIYSFDGTPQARHPFQVVEHTYEIRRLQPRGAQRHAVFYPVGRETMVRTFERNPADPRISHTFNLETDELGNVTRACSVAYGRATVDASLPPEVTNEQRRLHVTYAETDYTPDIDRELPTPAYRLRVPYESRSYEITGVTPASEHFQFDEIKGLISATSEIPYEAMADGTTPQRRLLARTRTLFLDDQLTPLPLGQWDTLGLRHEEYRLAFTPGVVAAHYGSKVTDADFQAAGYVHLGDADWWIPSGTALYPPDPAAHFYLPVGVKDPLGLKTRVTLDRYHLLPERIEVTQAPWHVVTAVNDYRVLAPVMITDPNQNRSAVEFDGLGAVVKMAVMGKAGAAEGDSLADPTARMEYARFQWMNHRQPNYVRTLTRERHAAADSRWVERYVYSNGSGGVALVKARVHPGKALSVGPDGTVTEVDADPRWLGSGRTIVNNKGNPVKRYEPYFSTTAAYEDEKVLGKLGVTPIFYYDALGRVMRTLLPNDTITAVTFNPWQTVAHDANDTVLESGWYAGRGRPDPATESEPADPERRAAWLAAKHAGTPGTVHLDSLGRAVYAVADDGRGSRSGVRSESDLTGRIVRTFDQEQREVAWRFTGMAGAVIAVESAERGRRWTFQDVAGRLVKSWDDQGREFRIVYDALHRPLSAFAREAGGPEILLIHTVYGERHPEAVARNLLGSAHQIFDQAGTLRVTAVDFKGNPLRVERVLAREYTGAVDWSPLTGQLDYASVQAAAAPLLDPGEVFAASAAYDALNRPTQVTLPDGTVITPTYNEAGFLSTLRAQIRGRGAPIDFLKAQDYDAKGQRLHAHYGNDVITRYFYDPRAFRLVRLLSHKAGADPAVASLQDLHYTYDPAGNITEIRDEAQQAHFFANAVVAPQWRFEYDALYQLIRATGREQAGPVNDAVRTHRDLDFVPQLPHVNDTAAVRTYTEEYTYDRLGNITRLRHRFKTQAGVGAGWTRHYRYAYQDHPGDRTNRLQATSLPGDPEAGPYSASYDHDPYGHMIRMPHLPELAWNLMDQLQRVDLGGGGRAYYVYDAGGQRIRRIVERHGGLVLEWIFLGAVWIFRRRRRNTGELRFERWTVQISDNVGPIARADTKTRDDDGLDPANPLDAPLIRYLHANHLGSAVLETDERGDVVSYEEFHPYGTTAYRSAKPGYDLSLKRFRFAGTERDDETGFDYAGARYYAAWLGRWTSSDPSGLSGGLNLYRYCRNSPIIFRDPTGLQEERQLHHVIRAPPGSPLQELRDPAKEAEARAALERIYTDRLIDPSQRFVIDQMRFVEQGRYWLVEKWHLEPRAGGAAPPAGGPAAETEEPLLPNPARIAQSGIQAANQPRTATGEVLEGSLNLWSSDERLAEEAEGYRLRQTRHQAEIEAEVERARAARGGRNLDWATEERPIWAEGSRRLAREGALSGRGVRSHGLDIHPNPAGTIQRQVEIPTVRRWGAGMAGLGALSGGLTLYSASQIDNETVRYIGYAGGAGEIAGATSYGTGLALLGRSAASARFMAVGTGLGRFAGGPAMIVLSGYTGYSHVVSGDYGVLPSDVAGVAGGIGVLAGSAPAAIIAGGVAIANIGGDWVESVVTPEYGRAAGVVAGTAAGAGVGAAVGAAVGVWFFGVGAGVGAAVGGLIGAVAGFIGSFW
ncbi:MAG TPA: toxin TcdB middle/N-terminal domain-containing protein [Limnochordia bacterium]